MNWGNVILWAVLIISALTLFAISSPIRFGIALDYRKVDGKRRSIGGSLWLSYIHPALFLYRYSSRGRHHEQLKIFGFDRRKKRHNDNDGTDAHTEYRPDDSDIDARQYNDTVGENVVDGNVTDNIHTSAHRHANVDADINASADANGDSDDPLWARAAERIKHIADEEHIAQAIEDIREIGASDTFRFLKDKALRKKVVKWLLRSSKRALGSVRLYRFKIWTRVGFKDPARAGKAYGYFIAAKSALTQQSRTVDIEMEPVFLSRCLEADTEFAGRTSIAMTVSGFLAIALTFPYWHIHKFRKSIGGDEKEFGE